MTNFEGYPVEELDEDEDDGTMVKNVETLSESVVGRKIVAIDRDFHLRVKEYEDPDYWSTKVGTALVLDDGTRVLLADTDNCCAHTELRDIVINLDKIEHVITGVGTTDGYTKWHIYANLGDVLELNVGWSCGNPFYYGYGFDIHVIPEEVAVIERIIDEES